jgi:hypothetical protein
LTQQIRVEQQPLSSTDLSYFAEQQQIGTRVKEYTGTLLVKSLLGISLSIVGMAFILAGVAVLILNPAAFLRGMYAGIFGAAWLSFGMFQLRGAARARGAHLSAGTEGVMQVKGTQTEVMRWNQIAAVQQTFTRIQHNYFLQAYILLRRDGTALTLEKSSTDFKALRKTIEAEVTRCQLPEAIAAYHAGHPVIFGAIMVNAQGISVQRQKEHKTLAWNEFKTVKVNDGRFIIKKQGAIASWVPLLIPEVPNLCVLLALIEHITNGQKRRY